MPDEMKLEIGNDDPAKHSDAIEIATVVGDLLDKAGMHWALAMVPGSSPVSQPPYVISNTKLDESVLLFAQGLTGLQIKSVIGNLNADVELELKDENPDERYVEDLHPGQYL